jgi:hypothetical protein
VQNPTPFSPVTVSYDTLTNTATFSFSGVLADANYRAALAAGNFSDTSNNPSAAPFTLDFFFLTADGVANGTVDIQDFNVLATNFGKSGMTYSQGNYDYSPDNTVTITDFNVLATRFGTSLPATSGAASLQSADTSTTSSSPATARARGTIGQPIASAASAAKADDTNLLNDAGLL